MKKFILSAFILFGFASLYSIQAQEVTESVEPKIAQLMDKFVNQNKSQTKIKGWRIQILATNDRQRMESALRKFENLYPSIPADWLHSKPYYKIRAGAFATKRDALRTLYILKQDYPSAYPVQDNEIRPEELLR